MADQTSSIARINQVHPTLALTTSFKTYELTIPKDGRPSRLVALTSDVDWIYSHDGVEEFPVAAGDVAEHLVETATSTVHARVASGTGTLYARTIG